MYKKYREQLVNMSKKSAKTPTAAAKTKSPASDTNGDVQKSLKVIVFLGSVRENRLGLRVAKFMVNQLESKGLQVTLFDPEVMNFDVLKKPVFMYGPKREGTPQWLLEAEEKVKNADAYVLVSGEYNHCIPPALTNMLDHFGGSSFSCKPSGLVTYSAGIFGGMRAAMQLRALTGELGCLSVSNIFGIPKAQEALDENGNPKDSHMESGATKLINQLEWMAFAMKNHRDNFGLPK